MRQVIRAQTVLIEYKHLLSIQSSKEPVSLMPKVSALPVIPAHTTVWHSLQMVSSVFMVKQTQLTFSTCTKEISVVKIALKTPTKPQRGLDANPHRSVILETAHM